uniref:Ig-like domain-containing protein n=1 Tax=Periophthalmus magnuspinnatus TaxID=409849 RepID=A0A3B3ZXJ1_9GOBI
MDRALITGLIVSCFGLHFALAQGGKKYFKVGNDIELRPPGTDKITQVLWKHNENLVAEWSKDSEVDYYSTFKGRTHLDTNTGVLVISSTTENDGGTYKVEINDRLLDVEYEVALIQEVPKPTVWVKPGVTDEERTLDCGGEVSKAAPVEYFWDIGPNENEPWVMFVERKITWKNNETTQMIQKLSCKMKNPLGEKSSDSGNYLARFFSSCVYIFLVQKRFTFKVQSYNYCKNIT